MTTLLPQQGYKRLPWIFSSDLIIDFKMSSGYGGIQHLGGRGGGGISEFKPGLYREILSLKTKQHPPPM